MNELSWLSLAPPLVAILAALVTRQVILSLFLGIWMGWTVLSGWNPLGGLAEALAQLIRVFESGYNTKVILFSALVGSLITLTQRSGGVEGFVQWMRSLRIGQTHRSAGLLAFVTGIVVFVESSITCLVVGSVSRPLSDRVRMAREKLAYICDSTSAPVCILIPLNAWGAYIMGLLAAEGVDRPLSVLAKAVPLNFYAWLALLLVLIVILTGWDFGPMKAAERRARETGKLVRDGAIPMIDADVISLAPREGIPLRRRNMMVPIATMILMMPAGLFITGYTAVRDSAATARTELPVAEARHVELAGLLAESEGVANPALDVARAAWQQDLETAAARIDTLRTQSLLQPEFFAILDQGSGSTAVFWAVVAAIVVAACMYLGQGILSLADVMSLILKGAGGLMPMAVIMMLAFGLNDTCGALGTGAYVAEATKDLLHHAWIPGLLFLISCFIAFSTGTSWGTFGIMMPIGVPLVALSGGSLPLAVAAIMGGGVFGDHCSPISDTSVVSSMATACDHIDHVRTQLPYALLAAAGAFAIYVVAGFVMS
ncbi:MAG: sodium:solute symporter [Candidatus Sumerlaeia bacterium]|nr:sodium:solute symporter [Candidatus Sumerlaeia bacterium]